jgi:hypothetical protein
MQQLIKKSGITSLELVSEINLFRNEEGNRATIQHKTLLSVIEDEFSDEIGKQEILPTSYTDKSNRQSKCYELTKSQATQILARESKFVRKAIVAKLERMEQAIIPLTQSEIILQQAQLLVDIERNQREFDNRLKLIEQVREEALGELTRLDVSDEAMPEETLRTKVRRLVNAYCEAKALPQQDVWNYIYDRMYYLYKVSIKSHKKIGKNETWLDVAERVGCLDKMFVIISDLIKKLDIESTQVAVV